MKPKVAGKKEYPHSARAKKLSVSLGEKKCFSWLMFGTKCCKDLQRKAGRAELSWESASLF